ncbi:MULTISPECIES: hypothetical protein [unclassified Pseudonocardia]|uniref:hypothetical protein n=1 Tax=unclassified Pseudonocardia TaxID=2619320 RepID=UPI000AC3F012|nr:MULTISPECIES: hypothetical protein [unclassified Pseudonocardia]
MGYQIIDPSSLSAEPGPHPAASPFDKRVSDHLGISAFEVYQVELPPEAETVRHDHRDDRVEDLYVILSGAGWLVVDDERVPVCRRRAQTDCETAEAGPERPWWAGGETAGVTQNLTGLVPSKGTCPSAGLAAGPAGSSWPDQELDRQ